MSSPPTKKKAACVAEAIGQLGLNCTLAEVHQWLRKHHGKMEISDALFYGTRKQMRSQAEARQNRANVPPPPQPEPQPNLEATFGGFLNAIESAKRLVAETGSKKNAKELIDLL